MSAAATPSLLEVFRRMEARLEAEPETVQAEIVRGTYLMSPRPRARHGGAQGRLFAALHTRFGGAGGTGAPDWLFVVEPEIRSERTFSRLAPDLAAWRRSTGGWPALDVTPIDLVPEWVAEVLSPSTAAVDRGDKAETYGAMGVGWMWLVDPDARLIETFANVRGRMVAAGTFGLGQQVSGEPFGAPVSADEVFVTEG
jgi:Uma2 family endonuclease